MMLFSETPEQVHRRMKGEPIPLQASYGGGLNSSAGLVLLKKLGHRPDAILFADTEAEKQKTYEHLEIMDRWCVDNDFPRISVVKRVVNHDKQKHNDKYSNLEEECLVKECLPSIAYYGRSCSMKWKHDPQDAFLRQWPLAIATWERGEKVIKAIFYDADEPERAKHFEDNRCVYWHPLIENNIGRDECVLILERAGLPIPPKSSCFFCPEMTPEEIAELERDEPDKLARALAMEANAELTSIKGLGKHEYSWADMVKSRYTLEVKREKKVPCMCYDGGLF